MAKKQGKIGTTYQTFNEIFNVWNPPERVPAHSINKRCEYGDEKIYCHLYFLNKVRFDYIIKEDGTHKHDLYD